MALSYSNTGGMGNRTASIPSVSQTAGAAVTDITKFIDGAYGATDVDFANDNWAVEFDFGTSKIITQAILWTTTTGNFVLRMSGSHDASSWEQIGSDETYEQDQTLNGNGFVFTCMRDNITAFRYYKLERVSGPGVMNAREIEFFINGASSGNPWTSFRYPDGTGDRTASTTMTASTNKGLVTNTLAETIDGAAGSAPVSCRFDTSVDTYLQWDFDTPQMMDAFRFQGFYGSANMHGVWNMLGSNDNWATAGDVIETDFGTPAGPGSDFTQILDSPDFYSSYRLQNVNGTAADSGQYWEELHFKLAPQMTGEAPEPQGPRTLAIVNI